MTKDEDLKSSIDYSEGQKEAAHRILVDAQGKEIGHELKEDFNHRG